VYEGILSDSILDNLSHRTVDTKDTSLPGAGSVVNRMLDVAEKASKSWRGSVINAVRLKSLLCCVVEGTL
jgi:hypothetical protein